MKSIHIREIDAATLASLKRLARSHHRSLQGELVDILERAAAMAPPENEPDLQIVTGASRGGSSWSREEIYGDAAR